MLKPKPPRPFPLKPRRLLEGKRMTIALGILASDGIVLCSDSRYTSSSKNYRDKILSWLDGGDAVCFALTGNEVNAKMAIDECREALSRIPAGKRTIAALRRAVRQTLKPLQESYVDKVPSEDRDRASFDFVIAIVSGVDGRAGLFSTSAGAIAEFTTSQCVGSGGYLGEYVLRKWNGPQCTVDQAVMLAMQALAAAKEHDAYCGGSSQFLTVKSGVVSGLVSYDVHQAEEQILRYEGLTSTLLVAIGDGTKSDGEFRQAVDHFGAEILDMRSRLRGEGGSHQALMQSLQISVPTGRISVVGEWLASTVQLFPPTVNQGATPLPLRMAAEKKADG